MRNEYILTRVYSLLKSAGRFLVRYSYFHTSVCFIFTYMSFLFCYSPVQYSYFIEYSHN